MTSTSAAILEAIESCSILDPDATENHMTAATRLLEKKREMFDLEQVRQFNMLMWSMVTQIVRFSKISIFSDNGQENWI